MSHHIDHTSRGRCRPERAQRQLRAQIIGLRRGLDDHARQYSTWQQTRPLRESRATVRMHLIEAQLARLSASDRMEAGSDSPLVLSYNEPPVVFAINAYRT